MPAATSSMPTLASSTVPLPKRFNTVTGFSQYTNRNKQQSAETSGQGHTGRSTVKGLFEGNNLASENGGINQKDATTSVLTSSNNRSDYLGSSNNKGIMSREDGPWSVSVAEAPPSTSGEKREPRKKAKFGLHMYTLYVTTPTHNLTLLRSNAELTELDSKIREGQSAATTLPTLPFLPVSTQQTSRKILQTLSRTLSPSVGRKGSALNNLTVSGIGLTEQISPTSSKKAASATPSASQSPASEETNKHPSSAHVTTINLANYLTTLSNLPVIRKHKAWRRFIRVGSEDLESIRVERRVRKVRSDLAQHVKSSVAPTNTNVGATPSQSDIGEEGTRTDDDRSISGQSTSNSYRRSDPPSRSASVVDPDRFQREDREASKKGGNFAGIPEEMEREKQALDQEMSLDDSRDEENTFEIVKRERRHRRHVQREAEKVTVDDFDMIRVLGKGCAGKVLLVRHLPTKGLFAMKSIHKRHVLAHQELQHTLTEQAVLKRMAKEVMDPFVVKLWWSFHDKSNLYLVMDFHPGGDLATQLSRWGRLGRDRARFYAAEIVEGVEGLHRAGVIYRDLKPENVLIGADGHIVLSDFGLSKEFPVRGEGGGSSTPPLSSPTRSHSSKDIKNPSPNWLSASEDNRSSLGAGSMTNSPGLDSLSAKGSRSRWADERDVTTTFCGTAEYLAPEVIQGAAYSYEVDWWSFGTMLYEMLTGITPFWADTHADMYVRVLHDELVFPDDRVLDQDTKSILRGLLQRNPMLRMKEPRIKRHPYFSMIEWAHVFHKRYIPPYIPPIDPLDETDTQNFDEAFLDMQPVVNGVEDGLPEDEGVDADMTAVSENKVNAKAKGELDGIKNNSKGASDNKSLFDGYSFRGRKDSESGKSSIFSTSAPSDHLPAAEGSATTTTTTLTLAIEAVAPPPPAPPASAPHVAAPVEASTAEDSEDDESAARAAVAALDQLEREAAHADEIMSSPPAQITAYTSTISNVRKANKEVIPNRVKLAGVTPGPVAETDIDGEDDWDMVDVPNSEEAVHSEMNGGKGQNLFARGVVDTYRMLRRQESSRIPSSPSYGSMNRPFNRLSRKGRPSKRNLRPNPNDQSANGSAISLGRSSANEGGSRVSVEEEERESRMGGPSPLPSSSAIMIPDEVAKAASPSLTSSEDIASQERNKQRLKKIKRFTSFFESNR